MTGSAKDYERAAEALRSLRQFLWENGNVGVMGRDHMARASRLLTEAAERMTWSPIETAPKDGTEILISGGTYTYDEGISNEPYPCNGVYIASWSHDDTWLRDGYGSEYDGQYWHKPTHWLPLPPAPGEPSAEEGG